MMKPSLKGNGHAQKIIFPMIPLKCLQNNKYDKLKLLFWIPQVPTGQNLTLVHMLIVELG